VDGDEAVSADKPAPEWWLRGPVGGVPDLLQPVAHGLLQCREEIETHLRGLTVDQIWASPSRAASIGFHARHAAGSLDRLFTYARGEQLSPAQRAALVTEGIPGSVPDNAATLTASFDHVVTRALAQLGETKETTLLDARAVGRAGLPSTVIGLLFHAAEHTQRHVGQLVTTIRFIAPAGDTGPP
jgi:uncharacterized damage-inducible protein DinB